MTVSYAIFQYLNNNNIMSPRHKCQAGVLRHLQLLSLGSNGTFSRIGVPPGIYTLRIAAEDPITREKKVIAIAIELDDSEDFCTTYLINRGLRIDGRTLIVEYSSTGHYNGFMCSLNRQEIPCKTSYHKVKE